MDQHAKLGVTPAGDTAGSRPLRSALVRLALYYLILVGTAFALVRSFPAAERALVTPAVPVLAEGAALVGGAPPVGMPSALPPPAERLVTTLLVVLAAVALALPVAWVYMLTKPLRYDPGLVRSVVILPIAVAGILLVVKNSLAIAFSLAGIVAAVRFRNTLKDPRDAVYIFLTIAIGIAAGVQAVDVALVVSLVFNVVVFALWRLRIGSLQAGPYGRSGVLAIGEPRWHVAVTAEGSEAIRRRALPATDGLKADGILLVHTRHPEVSRHAVGEALRQHAEDWHVLEPVEREDGVVTGEYLVELGRKSDPTDLLGELEEWSGRIEGAEFIPFHRRRQRREEPAEQDEDD